MAVLDRYVGEYKAASGFTAIFRREADKLFVKPRNNPEVALLARSETRFQDHGGRSSSSNSTDRERRRVPFWSSRVRIPLER